ncbi:MAG: transcription antitermination factor NusB [Pyrinomonadaceae bacterium]|nr:transcription antitermination factor NusB [Pyrinomonadaceae bacterium]MBP6212268.1 transcription antitermination factor NusB [Pyrinomonadaceae bacterium]
MSFEKSEKNTGTRHKARECALQMLFASDMAQADSDVVTQNYWPELGDQAMDEKTREFANALVTGTLKEINTIDDRIRTRAEHWRIERMAIVDRNVLRLAVYEFLFQETPATVIINEALEIARRFSTYEATQFINGVLDGIRQDLDGTSADRSAVAEMAESTNDSEQVSTTTTAT